MDRSEVERYQSQGYVVLESRSSETELDAIQSDILRLLDEKETEKAADPAYQELTRFRRFTVGLHTRSRAIDGFVQKDVFKGIGRAVIGKEVDLFFTSTITKSGTRNRSVDWHQDMVYDAEKNPSKINCWTSITESNPDNGGIFIIPGSHRAGLVPHERSDAYPRDWKAIGVAEDQGVPVILGRGQVLVFHPLVLHCSSECKAGLQRISLIAGYRTPKIGYSEAELESRRIICRDP